MTRGVDSNADVPDQEQIGPIVPVVVVAPYGSSFLDVIEKLKSEKTVKVVEVPTSLEAVSFLRGTECAVILFHGTEFNDIVKHITMLKVLKNQIQSERIRAIITTNLDQTAVVTKLAFYGCTEILREPSPARGLLFKVQRYVKILSQVSKGYGTVSKSSGPDRSRNTRNTKSSQYGTQPSDPTFRFGPPLDIESDFWLTTDEAPKKVGSKWVVHLVGPPANVGEWKESSETHQWIWNPTDLEQHPYFKEEGKWTFSGQKPLFKTNRWMFVGEELSLRYFEGTNSLGDKVVIDNFGSLVIAKNSEAGQRALPSIEESLNRVNNKELGDSEKDPGVDLSKGRTAIEIRGDYSSPLPPGFQFVEPLTLQSDCWLMGDQAPLWSNQRWNISIQGPNPESGNWIEIEDPFSRKRWRWMPEKPDQDFYIKEYGAWEFVGGLPKFEKGLWVFVSDYPELLFIYQEKTVGAKFSSKNDHTLLIASDSKQAQDMFKKLADSQTKETQLNSDPARQNVIDLNLRRKQSSSQATKSSSSELGILQPRLSPLLLALLISETMNKYSKDSKAMAQRICQYLSESLSGTRVELWAKKGENWTFIQTSDGSEGRNIQYLSKIEFTPQLTENKMISPILYTKNTEDEMIGALIFEGPSADLISVDIAQTYATFLKGMMIDLAG